MMQFILVRRGRLGRFALITVLGILGGIVITKIMPDVTDNWEHNYTNSTTNAPNGDYNASVSSTLEGSDQQHAQLQTMPKQSLLDQSYFSFYDARNNLVLDNRPHTRGYIRRTATSTELSWFKRVQDRAVAAVKDPKVMANNCTDIRYRLLGEIGVELEVTCYTQGSTISVSMLGVMGPTAVVGSPRIRPNATLNLAMALSGRVEQLKLFLSNLNAVIKKRPQSVVLTIAYFADNNTQEVSKIASDAQDTSNLTVNFLLLNETFSRGGGLRTALTAMNGTGSGDRIVWLCDVDMAFTEDFIDRCRSTPIRKKQVFMPIVFSQYNQSLHAEAMGTTANYTSQGMPVPRDNEGYWRIYGHGNVCAYRSDLLAVGAFNVKRKGWGGEDVDLFRRFAKKRTYRIVRSLEPHLVHRFHAKNCDGIVGAFKRACVKVKAISEASQFTFGILHFLTKPEDLVTT